MRKNLLSLSSLLLCLWVCFLACKNERDPCLQPKQTSVGIKFYKSGSQPFSDTILPAAALIAIDNDSLKAIVYGAAFSGIRLPLEVARDETRWLIQPDTAVLVFDTLIFTAQRQLHFISSACGYTQYYTLTNVTSTHMLIDSVLINNEEVTNDVNVENVQVFY